MPTATIGSPQTIVLGATNALIVSCAAADAVASIAAVGGFVGAPYEVGRVVGEQGRRFGPYGRIVTLVVTALSGAISADVDQVSAPVATQESGADGSVYFTRASRDRLVVNGGTVDIFPLRMQMHDVQPAAASLIDPISGLANFSLLNVGQQLQPIPGAVSPPYWTDPGPLLYTIDGSSAGYIPATVPGQIDFVVHTDGEKCVQFTCPAGFGEGAAGNGKRRIQLQSAQFTTRVRVLWDLSFLIPDGDDAPYDAATGYNYPMLLWQAKTDNSQPFWVFALVTTADRDVYQLRISWLYSDYSSDVSTYRRQLNANSAGSSNSASSNTIATATVRRGQWNDLKLEMFLDERDITTAAGGEGYALISLNDELITKWSGPTVGYKDIDGNPPAAPRWSLGLYLYEFFSGGVPAHLDELDLNRQFNPAPNTRRVLFRRACMRLLQRLRQDKAPAKTVGSSRSLSAADNGEVLECTAGGLTLTVPDTLPPNFSCRVIPNGTTSIARSGTALLNGAGTTLTRAAASNPLVDIQARGSSSISFVVTGS